MRSHRLLVALALTLAVAMLAATNAHGVIPVGQHANAFTKNQLAGTSAGPAVSLSDYGKQVKILFILGFS